MRAMTATLWTVAMIVGVPPCSSIIIDLSSKNLSSVPPGLPPSTGVLDLSCNHIHTLHRDDFQNTTHLIFLNLSWNVLHGIHPETFHPTPLLEGLDLSHNRLQNLSDQRYLQHTPNLQDLDLAFNKFVTMALGKEFSSLKNLMYLSLGADEIRVEDFANIANLTLTCLTLQLHRYTTYEKGSLKNVRLHKIRINMTTNPGTDKVLSVDALLMFTKVDLTGLKGNYTYLPELLKEQGAVTTTHLYLTDVKTSWGQVTDTINAVFHSPIAHLTVTDIMISIPPHNETLVSRTSNTQSFSLSRAKVASFLFSQEALYNFLINMPVENLDIGESSFIHMTCPKAPSRIHQLDFSNCALSDTVFSSVVSQETVECRNLDQVVTLVMSGNNLKSLQVLSKRLQYMSSLRQLDLSLNSLRYNSREENKECFWPQNIIKLDLSSNRLSQDVFGCLPKGIVTLNLQNNQISTVPSVMLKLKSLSTLDLSANLLRDLPVCGGFPNLKVLLLRKNIIHAPTVRLLKECPWLEKLDVSRNPFICTCAVRSFKQLGAEQVASEDQAIKLLHWPLGYYCSYPRTLKDKTLEEFWLPDISCSVGLLAAAILCPAVALIVGVLTLCRRFDVPWYLGMIWQWSRAKHRARTEQIRPEDLEGVLFHAFVSYSQHDAEWVKGQLLPNLEGSGSALHICHHERDFVPGKTIVENILRCIERSRRCVFVLSPHFVRSEWCHYELYFAGHQGLTCATRSVILVLLQPLPRYMIPSKYHQLKAMMAKHTFLEWPQDRAKHRLFWANLRAALQADLPNAPVRDMD
ncbi:toll-like receptor 1 [Osmerus eperlanus]|uniref:toll-like receptor 1 n=1 Tax=Osmerus eperlanus TaxID=29151 RepID=UPI002E125B6B